MTGPTNTVEQLSRSGAGRLTRFVAGCWSAVVLATAAGAIATPASAHPHIWVSIKTTVLYDKGTIVGFRHAWTFDEYYTAMAVEGLDTNKDGKYSREELAELAKVNIDGLKEFDYFTYPKLKGAELAVGAPQDFYLEYGAKPPAAAGQPAVVPLDPTASPPGKGGAAGDAPPPSGVLTLNFTLPLAKPVLADAEGFGFTITDPTFFIAFEPSGGDAMALGAGAPKGCRLAGGGGKDEAAGNGAGQPPPAAMAQQPADATITFVQPSVWQVVCSPGG